MKKIIMGLCAILFLLGSGWVLQSSADEMAMAPAAGALDNKTFVGEMGDKGKEKGDADNFVFKDGKFLSTACVAYGFGDAVYTTEDKEGVMTFSAETSSEKMGKMKWEGTVKDDTIEGTATMMSEGKEPAVKWFKGKLGTEEAVETKTEPKVEENK